MLRVRKAVYSCSTVNEGYLDNIRSTSIMQDIIVVCVFMDGYVKEEHSLNVRQMSCFLVEAVNMDITDI